MSETKTTDRLKVTQIGNSLGLILPKELLGRLRLEKGDTVFVTETPTGVQLTTHDAEFERQMSVMRDVMKTRRNALRELAK